MQWGIDWPGINSGAISVVAGFVGAIMWEGLAKPARERRILAGTFLAELRLNYPMAALALDGLLREPSVLPVDLSLSRTLYLSVVGRVGELPATEASSVVALYTSIEELNKLPRARAELIASFPGVQRMIKADLISEDLAENRRLLQVGLTAIVEDCEYLVPALYRIWRPWWNPKRWVQWKPPMLTEAGLAELRERTKLSRRGTSG